MTDDRGRSIDASSSMPSMLPQCATESRRPAPPTPPRPCSATRSSTSITGAFRRFCDLHPFQLSRPETEQFHDAARLGVSANSQSIQIDLLTGTRWTLTAVLISIGKHPVIARPGSNSRLQGAEGVDRAQVPGPYVLAGHSFGGLYILSFAAQFPDQVAGMVLLDSTAPRPGPAQPTNTESYSVLRRVSALLPRSLTLEPDVWSPSSPTALCRHAPGTRRAPIH